MTIEIHGETDVGRQRDENQDAYISNRWRRIPLSSSLRMVLGVLLAGRQQVQ